MIPQWGGERPESAHCLQAARARERPLADARQPFGARKHAPFLGEPRKFANSMKAVRSPSREVPDARESVGRVCHRVSENRTVTETSASDAVISPGKGGNVAAHHRIDCCVEIGKAGARRYGVIQHPAGGVDAEAQDRAGLRRRVAGRSRDSACGSPARRSTASDSRR